MVGGPQVLPWLLSSGTAFSGRPSFWFFLEGWIPPGVQLPEQPWAIAAIIRITGGNFRLLSRLLTQMERILEINELHEVTKAVVEAARETLVIGET